MSLNLRKPIYSSSVIGSLESLSAAVRLDKTALLNLASNANGMYREVPPKPGSTRQTFDARGILKVVHKQITSGILKKVHFPDYLTGSLKGKDYKTNAAIHSGQHIVICEDVKGFFPSVTRQAVYDVWRNFFNFSPTVAEVLTDLTTKDGTLPQGSSPSSYLANLVLWRHEPLLEAKLRAKGITYSRYVDDMAMSSKQHLPKPEVTQVVADVYGMLRKVGLRAGRHKHEIFTASERMIVTKLMVNQKPSLESEKRAKVRAAVFELERKAAEGVVTPELLLAISKVGHRIGQLGRFHPTEATHLKERLRQVRIRIDALGLPAVVTTSTVQSRIRTAPSPESDDLLPWEPLPSDNGPKISQKSETRYRGKASLSVPPGPPTKTLR